MPQTTSSEPRPELLFIAPDFPLPADRGQRIRILNLVKACARDFAVTFVAPPPEAADDARGLDGLCARVILIDPAKTGRGDGRLTLGERISPRQRRAMAPYRAALATLDLGRFRAIWVERGHLAGLAAGFRDRTIVDLDDIEHVRHLREMGKTPSLPRKLKMTLRAARLVHRETLGMRGFAGVVVCSESDRAYLARFGLRAAWVVPNGTDLAGPTAALAEPDRDCVFMGNCDYPPNADAVAYLRDEVAPLLRGTRRAFRVDLIGPASDRFDDPAMGVVGRGYVEDLGAELSRYRAFVAPLRLGGGTKLKIIDAMAAGVPVVTTPIGAEGLDLVHGEHALIAHDAASFAAHVADLLERREEGLRLARNAAAHVRRRFAWSGIREALADRLKSEFGA
ncbi:glycosyltransferase [Methylopila sp. M107]|uniref:glycosyltransferase n=1 Tax=Methylopila sp. M107 TaxID=1101190 RepID=UPI000365D09D|nr:glycosyltransferase [Methylopila sp. M107]